MLDTPATNAPELTVTELSGALKRTVEDRFGFVRLRGEISGYRGPHSSGHAYFCIKDAGARIDAVCWKTTFSRLKTRPEDGLEVIATGKITTFPGKSTYQIVVEAMEPAGVGALMALFEDRRRKLAAEGLFDAARKKPVPFLPTLIGIVTSPTGSVIRDILHRLADRYPVSVVVWPARMQGETSAAEVASGIAGLNALPAGRRPDVIIVARGGGSLEDLWSFNEEAVVRAAIASAVPLVSAIGHETDWTLLDHAADLRAPTPTGAAEMVVPVRQALLARWADAARRLPACTLRGVERRRADVRGLARALPGGDALLALPRQRLDAAAGRLAGALGKGHDAHRIALARFGHRLMAEAPTARLAHARQVLAHGESRMRRGLEIAAERRTARVEGLARRLSGALAARLRVETSELRAARRRVDDFGGRAAHAVAASTQMRQRRAGAAAALLKTLGYRNVIERGFALVRDSNGAPLRSAAGVAGGARLEVELADGRIDVLVVDEARRPRRPAAAEAAPRQGRLF